MVVSSSTVGFGTRSSMTMNGAIRRRIGSSNSLGNGSSFLTKTSACWKLRGGSSSSDDDDDDSDADSDEESDDDSGRIKVTSPLKLLIRTNLIDSSLNDDEDQSDNCNAIDISPAIELMCTRTRNILSIKQSLSRSLRGRPPLELLQLVDSRTGQTLSDESLVQELADDDDDEDMEEVTLYLDMIPPVDPKFGTLLPEQLQKASTQQLLDMYAANIASMHANTHALYLLSQPSQEDEDDEHQPSSRVSVIWDLKQHASAYKQYILSNLLTEEQRQQLLQQQQQQQQQSDDDNTNFNNDSFSSGDVLLKESVKRKSGIKGGATMQVKRVLQKNLNINWPDTIRNFFLFLFFGYFGGRDVFSRTLMLLGAPMCFVLQLRPIKVMIKQLFYAIGQPPAIFLSLLAAPQQAIMDLDYNAAMRNLYGDDAPNDLMSTPSENENLDDEYNIMTSLSDEDDFEEYDDDDDDDDDYDQYDDE